MRVFAVCAVLCAVAAGVDASGILVGSSSNSTKFVCIARTGSTSAPFTPLVNVPGETAVNVRYANKAYWIPGYSGKLWKSEDDGFTWKVAFTATAGSQCPSFYDVIFTPGGMRGWIVCDQSAHVWRTTDGGKSWSIQVLTPGLQLAPVFSGAFANDTHGAMFSSLSSNYFITVNGGDSWTNYKFQVPATTPGDFSSFGAVTAAAGGSVFVAVSTKHGQTVATYLLADVFGRFMPRVDASWSSVDDSLAASKDLNVLFGSAGNTNFTSPHASVSVDAGKVWHSVMPPHYDGPFGAQVDGVTVAPDGSSLHLLTRFEAYRTTLKSALAGAPAWQQHYNGTAESCQIYSIAYSL